LITVLYLVSKPIEVYRYNDSVAFTAYLTDVGPCSPNTVQPTHRMADGALRRIRSAQKMFRYGASPVTVANPTEPLTGTPSTGLFSDSNSDPARYVTEDIGIWDRLPVEDFRDFELPSKVKATT
jgi:hypothetical protein